MATWTFLLVGDEDAVAALSEIHPSTVLEADGRWTLQLEAPYDEDSKLVTGQAQERLEFLLASSLLAPDQGLMVSAPLTKAEDDGRNTQFVTPKRDGMRFSNGGIRMVLHERAPEALDADLTIPDIATEFPSAQFWLSNYLLNSAFRGGFKGAHRAVILTLIRRARHAVKHYVEAREATLRYAKWDRSAAVPAGDFYGAIESWENCLLQLQMFYEVFNQKILRQTGKKMYESGDGSVEQRVAEMANDVKHSGRNVLTEADLTPVWLTAGGVASLGGYQLSYEELAGAVRDVAEFASKFRDPAGVVQEVIAGGRADGDGPAEEAP